MPIVSSNSVQVGPGGQLAAWPQSRHKAGLRTFLREQRKIFFQHAELFQSASLSVQEKLLEHELWKQASVLIAYHAAGGEVDTALLVQRAWNTGKQVYFPRCYPDTAHGPGRMDMYLCTGEHDLCPGRYGISEPRSYCTLFPPEVPALLLVPGLAFDRNGFRLGQGGGYYDRWLARHTGLVSAGLAFSWQVVPDLKLFIDRDPWDCPVDCVFTDKEIVCP